MKTKFLKIGLPIMVFMMAIAFAFASVSTTKAEDASLALVPGYIMDGGICKMVTTCSDNPGPPCLYNGSVIARIKINETTCGSQWFHPFN